MTTLNFANIVLMVMVVAMAVLFVVVIIRALKVASGRGSRRGEAGGESAMLSVALQDALTKLKEQERATAARAEASQRLADQIVEGLTSGLVVVDRTGTVQAVNPAAQRILEIDGLRAGLPFRQALHAASPLSDLIFEALQVGSPI